MRMFFKVLSAILGLLGIFTVIAGVSAVEKELSYIWIVGIGIALFVFGAVVATVIYDKEDEERLVKQWHATKNNGGNKNA